ncbi:hypothetical protein VTI28DRAFT_4428 [Corynascus sepedonium]
MPGCISHFSSQTLRNTDVEVSGESPIYCITGKRASGAPSSSFYLARGGWDGTNGVSLRAGVAGRAVSHPTKAGGKPEYMSRALVFSALQWPPRYASSSVHWADPGDKRFKLLSGLASCKEQTEAGARAQRLRVRPDWQMPGSPSLWVLVFVPIG